MNRKIKKICEYRDDYCNSKKQVKRHMCRISCTDRKLSKKKNHFDERKYADKLYQRRFDKEIKSAKRR